MTMPRAMTPPKESTEPSADRLGDLLVSQGAITRDQLTNALSEQRTTHQRLGYILVKQGSIGELELTKMLARQSRMPAVDLSRFESRMLPV